MRIISIGTILTLALGVSPASAHRELGERVGLTAPAVTERIRKLEDLGVTDAVIGFRVPYQRDTTPLETKLQSIRMYADTVLSKVR